MLEENRFTPITAIDAPLAQSGFTVLGMALAVSSYLPLNNALSRGLFFIGVTLVYLAGGLPAALRALAELWKRHTLDIDLLMVIAAVAAAAVGAPLEGAVLLTLFSVSTALEQRAMDRAKQAVEALMALRPETALLKSKDGEVNEVPASDLKVNDVVVLRPGARVPADGVVVSGHSSVDESTITGESMPVVKDLGDPVLEATVNLDGAVEVAITKVVGESTVARMIGLVTEAQAAKAPSERFSAWFGQRYTIAVLTGAIAAFAAFHWFGRNWEDSLYRAATLLVAASPCAIVISVPAAILSALSAAARTGVLFKGGAALETLSSVDTFAFDKTGTLTTGKAVVTEVVALDGDEARLLSLLAGVEAQSEHHNAAAIRQATSARGIAFTSVNDVSNYPSAGIVGTIAEGQLWAGNSRLAAQMSARIDHPALIRMAGASQTIVYLGLDQQVLGAVSVADQVRSTSGRALTALRANGIRRIVMMTGDRRTVALRVGEELGLHPHDIHAEMLPEDKVRMVSELASISKVAFVGDGVNDAAALARADVGVAMGAAGSDVALQAADIALLSEDMSQLAEAHRLARRTTTIIRQNLIFAIGAMAILVVGGLFFDLPLPLTVIGHEGGTVLVVLNGLRLLATPSRGHSPA